MVGLGLRGDVLLFGPGFGSGLPGWRRAFGPGLVLGPVGFTLLHNGEIQVAVPMAEAEHAVEAMLEDDPVLGPDAVGLVFVDLITDVLVADGEVVGHAPGFGPGEQLFEVHLIG